MVAAAAPWVEAGPFRAHLRHLMDVGGLDATEVAVLAGVPPRMATSLVRGRNGRPVRRISPAHARALIRVGATDVRDLRTRQVPAAESRLRLRRMLAGRGGGPPALAVELGVAASSLDELAHPGTAWCSALVALRLLTASRTRPGAVEAPPVPLGVAA
ncbi:hypothetical protein SAMN04488543_0987 [Friedmanniella luteola]|uniref:Helix-turn-helix domain-containing protein n=1 Tax=Friedmanniella luteola TaxID=546871 RepID=A0A1H1P3V2_9ACTN|nr:hypothetical protein [Friedmanniella luteola]SDS05872.1 hypothetical protein SAMN04488543_0987 [Friedmanniella luteola]